ncbi:MAG: CDGSH iron-sulfur domain-containing protein [Chloroflexi bacterium]|nr:CDGSH iron-sulfur domain-containing protein [Chloroflexota bacterium]
MEPVEEAIITVRANGPYRINGRMKIVDHEGNVLFEGTNVVLCRCGHSESKPFCDSSHRRVGFQSVVNAAPSPAGVGTESHPS